MSLLLLFGGTAAAPQTWTGNAGTVQIDAASGTFTAATQWVGTAATIQIDAASGTFTAAATWAGNQGTVTIIGTPGGWPIDTVQGSPHGQYHPITFGQPEQPDLYDQNLALVLALT